MALATEDSKPLPAPIAMVRRPTITRVEGQTKRVPHEVLKHFAHELEKWVDERFGGNQTHAGKLLGISQGHISALIRSERGPGLNVMIALREQTGRSLDELLGLIPPRGVEAPTPVTSQLAQIQEELASLREEVLQQPNRRMGPHSKAGKRFAEVERARQHAVGQRHLDAKAHAAAKESMVPASRGRRDKAG